MQAAPWSSVYLFFDGKRISGTNKSTISIHYYKTRMTFFQDFRRSTDPSDGIGGLTQVGEAKAKIMIVDDSRLQRFQLKRELEQSGYEIQDAASGKEIWSYLQMSSMTLSPLIVGHLVERYSF